MNKLKQAKMRCICCEEVGGDTTKEHYWPRWLLKSAKVTSKPCDWITEKKISLWKCTIPLCKKCNNTLGHDIESVVNSTFQSIESENGLTYDQARVLVLWMWKFEGLMWNLMNPDKIYSEVWTMKERVLGQAFTTIADDIVLCIARTNGPETSDKPVGLCSPIGGSNAILVSGVFCGVAIIVTLMRFAHNVDDRFSKVTFSNFGDLKNELIFPPISFGTGEEAIEYTRRISLPLYRMHESLGQQVAHEKQGITLRRPRIVLPQSEIII